MILRRSILILRLVLGAVFLYAAWTKLRASPLIFAMSVDSYQLLPEWAVLAVAYTLPWVELLVGILLLAGLWLRYAATAASAILVMFFALMLRSYVQGQGIDCGCFGVGEAISVLLTLAAFKILPGRVQKGAATNP
jgi:putative oxidoreductase